MSEPNFILEQTENLSDGITAEITFPSGIGVEAIELPTLTDNQREQALGVKVPVTIKRLIKYFRVKDDTGKVKYKYSPAVRVTVKYTHEEWYAAYDKDLKRPRIYYLISKTYPPEWEDHWVEFTNKDVKRAIPPEESGDSFGYVFLKIKEVEDPLIGGPGD